jgi:hypothetical protein
MVLMIIVFHETRGSVLPSRKAKVLNQGYEDLEIRDYDLAILQKDGENKPQNPIPRMRWKVKNDEERSPIMRMIKFMSAG